MSTIAAAYRSSRHSSGRFLLGILFALIAVAAGWMYFAWNWSYAQGERAGWVQKFSEKGWLCKTWEGEVALVAMPGAIPEKFNFTVLNDEVAAKINRYMGRRVAMHYEQKVGLPTSCFGETRYYVTEVKPVDDGPNPQGMPSFAPGAPAQPGQPTAPGVTAPAVPGAVAPTPGLPSVPAPAPAAPAAAAPPAPAQYAPAPQYAPQSYPAQPPQPGQPAAAPQYPQQAPAPAPYPLQSTPGAPVSR
jgi:hypothetical protein